MAHKYLMNSSTDCLPRWYWASMSMETLVPWLCAAGSAVRLALRVHRLEGGFPVLLLFVR